MNLKAIQVERKSVSWGVFFVREFSVFLGKHFGKHLRDIISEEICICILSISYSA